MISTTTESTSNGALTLGLATATRKHSVSVPNILDEDRMAQDEGPRDLRKMFELPLVSRNVGLVRAMRKTVGEVRTDLLGVRRRVKGVC